MSRLVVVVIVEKMERIKEQRRALRHAPLTSIEKGLGCIFGTVYFVRSCFVTIYFCNGLFCVHFFWTIYFCNGLLCDSFFDFDYLINSGYIINSDNSLLKSDCLRNYNYLFINMQEKAP